MSLIIEDGSGVTDANSYVTIASCTEYLDSKGLTLWGTATTGQEVSLIQACLYLELLPWKGQKALSTYTLQWPRRNVLDRNRYYIYSDTIPVDIPRAQCELAYRYLNNSNPIADVEPGDSYVTRESVGPVQIEYSQAHSTNPKFVEIDLLLAPYLENRYGVVVERS